MMNEDTTRDDIRKALLRYLDTDTIWYRFYLLSIHMQSPNPRCLSFHQGYPEPLVRMQDDHWNPLLTWARDTFDVELFTSESVLFRAQPAATKRKFDKVLQGFDPWQMAGDVPLSTVSRNLTQRLLANSDGTRDVYNQIVHHSDRTGTWPHHC
jgi:ATP synthase F1 complex assembly factor 2